MRTDRLHAETKEEENEEVAVPPERVVSELSGRSLSQRNNEVDDTCGDSGCGWVRARAVQAEEEERGEVRRRQCRRGLRGQVNEWDEGRETVAN